MSLLFGSLRMLSNYFKTTYRHASKNKLNFIFKVSGLTLAFFSFIIIAIYISFQFSFDKFHTHYDNIYRVNSLRKENGKDKRWATVPTALGPAMKATLPEVKEYCILSEWGTSVCRANDQLHRVSFLEADSSVFNVFTFEFVKGDKSALNSPSGLVITESLAKQLFADQEPINQFISFPDRFNRILEVRAVIKDLPTNSSIDTKAIMVRGALADDQESKRNSSWSFEYGGNLFVLLEKQADLNGLVKRTQNLIDKNMPKPVDGVGRTLSVVLEPFSEIYLSKPWRYEFDRKGNALYVYVFISLAVFLLLIATINYLNLSIADFSFRRKEMGVRKVLGALKRQIIFQTAFEALLNCLLALILSIGLLYFSFQRVAQIFDANLRFSMLFNLELVLLILAVVVLIVAASSAYPTLQQATADPIGDMRKQHGYGKNFSINQILLLTQFSISIFCVTATWVAGNQLYYIQTKDIGLDRNNLLSVFMPDRYPVEKAPVLKEEIAKLSQVESASFSYYRVTGSIYQNSWYQVEIGGEMKPILLNELFVDEDFLRTAKIQLVEGRNFQIKSEFKTAFIVNERAVKEFGWTNPIGKKITVGVPNVDDGIWSEGNVIGVVRDFNTRSLHKSIEPLVIRLQYDSWPGYCLNIRYHGPQHEIVPKIKNTCDKIVPGFLMDYESVSDRYDEQYKADRKAYTTLQAATWIVLLISCIGIFSISIFMSVKRQREFGIRKIVGATVSQIATLHIVPFFKIAMAAILISSPFAYWISKWWLDNFVYKEELSTFPFLVAGVLLITLIIATASYSAWKSARMNPVDVIKND